MENGITAGTIDESQRRAARAAGAIYLLAMITGIAGFATRSSLMVPGDALKTIQNVLGSERMFRVSTALDLFTASLEAALAVALYVLLKRVSKSLAMLAAFWRVTDGAILGGLGVCTMAFWTFLGNSSYLRVFTIDQLHVMARLALSAYANGFTIAFFFLALGALLFSCLFYKSRYIPRSLAALGIFAYAAMLSSSFLDILFPEISNRLGLIAFAPAFIFEVFTGFWLLLKGVDAANWGWFSREA